MEMKGNTPFIGVLETYVEGITNLFKPKAKKNKNELPGNIIKYKAYNMLVEEDYGLNINAFGEAQLIDHTFEYDEELGYGVGILTFDKEVTTIVNNGIVTWDYNNNILEIILPNTITTIESIGNIMGTVNIPKYLEVIGNAAFYSCRGMTNVVIPKTVRQIGLSPFRGKFLESIMVEKENPYYDSRNNCNAIIDSLTNVLISGCKNTVIPNDVIGIGNSALDNSYSVLADDKRNFTIPASVTFIGNYALSTQWIKNLIMESSIPPSLGEYSPLLGGTTTYLIYVPDEAVNVYKNSLGWSDYSNKIHGISEFII